MITSGARGRKTITITNTDGTNAIYLRAFRRNAGTTSSTNFSFYVAAGQTFTAQEQIHGRDLTESEFFALAVGGSPVISWEGIPN